MTGLDVQKLFKNGHGSGTKVQDYVPKLLFKYRNLTVTVGLAIHTNHDPQKHTLYRTQDSFQLAGSTGVSKICSLAYIGFSHSCNTALHYERYLTQVQ